MAPDFRVLLAPDGVDQQDLAALYRVPALPWFRANMVTTIDGAAAGADGGSGSINNAADGAVFALLRGQADAIVVGAGTARAERYRPIDRPIVVVSGSGAVPDTLRAAPSGGVVLATRAAAEHLGQAREVLGAESVWVLGEGSVDLGLLRSALLDRGWTSLLCEGGPRLLRDFLAAGLLDEICLTWVPRLLGGTRPSLLAGESVDRTLKLRLLLEADSTLLGRWLVEPGR
ncbi:MAG: dihydrofolate reductase family protein [Nocardioides sp.]